jgi:bifunctional aspartokinase / homoserine dehydrogenase 1
MIVMKFGGSSVGSAENIRKVASIVKKYKEEGKEIAVVVSAFQEITNMLISAGEAASLNDAVYKTTFEKIQIRHYDTITQLFKTDAKFSVQEHVKEMLQDLQDLFHGVFLLKELSPRTHDLIKSFGERLSAYIISQYFTELGLASGYCDARLLIKTDNDFGSAKVNFTLTNEKIKSYFKEHGNKIQVITGFVSSTEKDETTTLGRGGSDYTAAIFGAALDAALIEIWTDVDGVMTADPRKVKAAFSLPTLSYNEAMELSHFGAKVIYPPTLQPAFASDIPLKIRNTFNPDFPGTHISKEVSDDKLLIKGISSIQEITLLNFTGSGIVGVPGVSSRVFGVLAKHKINVILITQASSEHSICIAVEPSSGRVAKECIESEFESEIKAGTIDKLILEEKLSILAVIGDNMRNTPGIAGKLFSSLGKNGINIVAVAQGSSEYNISVVIHQEDLSKALNTLHETFFLSETKSLNLFIIGMGLIGGTLIRQIQRQWDFLFSDRLLKIQIVGVANSKKMLFDANGLPFQNLKEKLIADGDEMNTVGFFEKMKELNLPNSVFVDCTSSKEIISHYREILRSSISIVTPNKLANSGSYESYRKLQRAAFRRGIKYMYETNVGAGLPVINTLRDLKYSGDKILMIEGVLSGTLSYIFNTFKKGVKFHEVVKMAKEKGYTEPDPRDDLNGMDVARKILILAREAGNALELEDVQVEQILPESCRNAPDVERFFEELEKASGEFDQLLASAEAENKALRFIASLENGKASVSLQKVDANHPFYFLSGSDNMISFTTERYKERPLVIKGPGAGAEVTAAGVFAEIISISNHMIQDSSFIRKNGKK